MPNDGGGRFAAQPSGVLILKVLVTGAAGFTGKHLVAAAKARGHEVIDFRANLTDANSLKDSLSGVERLDAVAHLAGVAFVGHADPTAFYSVNTVGTGLLLDEILALQTRQNHPIRVLVASSANVYGNCLHSPISESHPTAPINHYAASKVAMEHLAMTFVGKLDVMITRPFNYTGPGQGISFLIPKIVDHFLRKANTIELGNMEVEREFNDVRMLCEAYLRLLERGQSGQIYNVCTGHPYAISEVLEALQRLTGQGIEVRVNNTLIRTNEVHRLCGSPARLIQCVGPLPVFGLEDTLRSMLT